MEHVITGVQIRSRKTNRDYNFAVTQDTSGLLLATAPTPDGGVNTAGTPKNIIAQCDDAVLTYEMDPQ